jgi:hypothetical protein
VRSTTLLQYWGTRGLFYIFVALFTLKEYSQITWESFSKLSLVVNIISFAYLAMGCIYIFMGLVFSRDTREQKMARYNPRLNLYENSGYGSGISVMIQSGAIPLDLDSYHSVQ